MASGGAAAAEANFKTLVLKVSIHCEGCKRKVSRILSKIEGVESVDIDTRQNKVSFKSLVDAQTVIQKLKKHGKPAELLQEVSPSDRARKPATETEKAPEPAKIGVEGSSPSPPSAEAETETVMAVDNSVTEAKETTKDEPPEKPLKPEKVESKMGNKNIEDALNPSSEEEKSKKIEEFKDEHHTPRQVFPTQPTYVMSYGMAQPSMSQSHFVPPMATVSPQGNIYDDHYRYFPQYYDGPVGAHTNPTGYMHQQANDPYNTMFSDENPDSSCSLM